MPLISQLMELQLPLPALAPIWIPAALFVVLTVVTGTFTRTRRRR